MIRVAQYKCFYKNLGLIFKGVVRSWINWFVFSLCHASEASMKREPWQVCLSMITLLPWPLGSKHEKRLKFFNKNEFFF